MADYLGPMDHEGYCAEAFYVEPDKCFRMVISANPGSQGSPTHCPDPVEFQGRFQDGTGKWHEVWACMEQAADLPYWKRVRRRSARNRTMTVNMELIRQAIYEGLRS
jgi:hypothetical protein